MVTNYDYIDASISDVIALVATVTKDSGGRLSEPMAARNLGRSPKSSSYVSIRNAAVKLGLLKREQDSLFQTEKGKHVVFASEDEETLQHHKVFLSVPLYAELARRFVGRKVPNKDKMPDMLSLDYSLPVKTAKRVASRFIEDAQLFGIMDEGGNILPSLLDEWSNPTDKPLNKRESISSNSENLGNGDEGNVCNEPPLPVSHRDTFKPEQSIKPDEFGFHIWGPGGKSYRGEIGKKGYFAILGVATEMEAEFEGESEPFQKFRRRGKGDAL